MGEDIDMTHEHEREWTSAMIGAGLGLVVWALMILWPNEVATALGLLASWLDVQ